MSSLKYFGIPIVSIGLANPKEDPTLEVLVKQDPENNVYKKLVLKNNIIVGMTLVNCIERAGILFYLMKNTVNVKKFKAATSLRRLRLSNVATESAEENECGTIMNQQR